ncbi:MAG: hypothetical protein ACM3ZE_29170 [Myxococcales bacterium]
MFYLSGFYGSEGTMVVTRGDAFLLVDSRAAQELALWNLAETRSTTFALVARFHRRASRPKLASRIASASRLGRSRS